MDAALLAALLGIVALLWLPRLSGPIDLRYDAGVYYILGTSLAEGKGYALLNEPGEIQGIQYPPLLPAIVAVEQLILGTSDPQIVGPWLRITFLLMTLLYAAATYVMARHYLEPLAAFLVGAITHLHMYTFYLSDLLFAEIPFGLITVLFVVNSQRAGTRLRFAMATLLGTAAFLLRTAGIALLAAWVGESLLQKRWKQAAVRGVVLLVPFLGWQAYVASVRSGVDYENPAYTYQRAAYQYYNVSYGENAVLVDPFAPELGYVSVGGVAERFFGNVARMPTVLGESVTAIQGYWVQLFVIASAVAGGVLPPGAEGREMAKPFVDIPLVIATCLIAAGVIVLLRRRSILIPVYIATYIGLVCLTPWPAQFTRYLSPLVPFLALALIQAPVWLRTHSVANWSIRRQRVTSLVSTSLAVMILVVQGYSVFRIYRSFYRNDPAVWARDDAKGTRLFFYAGPWLTYDECVRWLGEHAEPTAVVATTAPHWVYLHTGLKSILPPMELDTDLAQRLLDSVPVGYVIMDDHVFLDTSKYIEKAVGANPERWALVFTASDGQTRVYRRID